MELQYWRDPGRFYRDKDITDGYLWEPDSQLPLIRFHSLDEQEWLSACFTTRRGGVSTGCLGEMNLGFSRGDVPLNIRMNFRRVTDRMGASFPRLAITEQVHETRLKRVEEADTVGEAFIRSIRRTDGLYTQIPGLVLSATFADCVPIYLADPAQRQISLVHSGWKGTVGCIGEKGVQALCALGSRPEDLIAVIGPCICRDHYEVTGEVIDALSAVFGKEDMQDIAVQTDDIHWLCDLPAACYCGLRRAGLKEDHIHFSGICTFENHDLIFSHRYTGGRRGNSNAFLMIKEHNK